MATTTNLNSLVINYLTQAQYDAAAEGGTLNENQLYLTPSGITAADISNWNNKVNKTGDTITGNLILNSSELNIKNSDGSKRIKIDNQGILFYNNGVAQYIYSRSFNDSGNIFLPATGGTLALTSDIPDVSGKIDTAGTGLSKSGTTLNHSNSITAQTTQGIYPIAIDAQGHITSYGNVFTPTSTELIRWTEV